MVCPNAFQDVQCACAATAYICRSSRFYKWPFEKDTLKRVTYIDISQNSLDLSVGEIKEYLGLVYLNLSQNLIYSINKLFTNMERLIFLDVFWNNITYISKFSFKNLIQLRYLFLEGNSITEVGYKSFYHLPNMRKLNLQRLSIEFILLGTFYDISNLESLDISSNKLTQIYSLKILNVTDSPIESVDVNIFQGVDHIDQVITDLDVVCCLARNHTAQCSVVQHKKCRYLIGNVALRIFALCTYILAIGLNLLAFIINVQNYRK